MGPGELDVSEDDAGGSIGKAGHFELLDDVRLHLGAAQADWIECQGASVLRHPTGFFLLSRRKL